MKPIVVGSNQNGINATESAKAYRVESSRPKASATAAPSFPSSGADQVTVSSRAEEVARLVAQAGKVGDIRQERVSHFRTMVQSGEYSVSSQSIADAIIRDES